MPLDYFTVAKPIFEIGNLSHKQKFVLCMVLSFRQGLKISNDQIAQWCNIKAERVSNLIADLERKKYIIIKNPQSKYRTISANPEHFYFSENAKVKEILLWGFDPPTLAFNTGYFSENTKQNRRNRKKYKKGCAQNSTPEEKTPADISAALSHLGRDIDDAEAARLLGVST